MTDSKPNELDGLSKKIAEDVAAAILPGMTNSSAPHSDPEGFASGGNIGRVRQNDDRKLRAHKL